MKASQNQSNAKWNVYTKWGLLTFILLTIILFTISIPVYYHYIKDQCISKSCEAFYNPPPGTKWLAVQGISPSEYSFAYVSIYVLFGIVFITAGLILFWKKSTELMGMLGSFMLVSLGGTFTPIMEGIKLSSPLLVYVVNIIGAGGMAAFILFFFLFPNGRFAPKWSKYLCFLLIILRVPGMIFPDTYVDLEYVSKLWGFGSWFILWIGSLLFVQIYRYRYVMAPLEKQQAKWVVYGVVMALVGLFSVTAIFVSTEKSISSDPYQLYYIEIAVHTFMILIPAAILIAMMKHRLWDIDIIVNRTLVYGIMTASTVIFYVLAVWYSGLLLQTNSHLISSLIATGIVAVLFSPIKQRVQRFINRRMYGENDDPYSVLLRLAQELENPMEPDSVLSLVVKTIRDSLKLPYASLSVYQDGKVIMTAEEGNDKGIPLTYKLLYRGEEMGDLKLSPRSPSEALTVSDRKFLDMLVRQASVVVHSAKASISLKLLAADLQESRENLVLAREEERRKLRSNLHDGLAPRLAALALTAAAAEDLVESNPNATREILGELRSTIRQTVSEIRSLVYDLRPPTLDEMGLIGAIHEQIKALSFSNSEKISFTLNVPETMTVLPAAVEVAAFRVTTEAIVNVVRHSKAKNCIISISANGKGLQINVDDDGIGLLTSRKRDSINGGIGIGSMKERVNELGGSFLLETNKYGGTTIAVSLPVNSDNMGERDEKA
ncbi:sensor histidine kinase [Neobacillus citreus]|uniref:histidine kinase n=1 Tax=Neobacillus citreus TaxID=2833578 RepID=A0A942Y7H6_9BACI|nr:sensor histidine kinase [Neobacillus citreus]MCH6265412.1 sensor histidine kinase [Neobacillus citreus]